MHLTKDSLAKHMASRGCWIPQNRELWARRFLELPDTKKHLAVHGNAALIRLLIALASTFPLLIVLEVGILGYTARMKSLVPWPCSSPEPDLSFFRAPQWTLCHQHLQSTAYTCSFLGFQALNSPNSSFFHSSSPLELLFLSVVFTIRVFPSVLA